MMSYIFRVTGIGRWFLVVDEPVVVSSICIPDGVIQYYQPLKLQLEFVLHVLIERCGLELVQI